MRSARCLSRAAIRSDASVTPTSTIELTLDRAGNVMGGIGAVSDHGGDKKRRVRPVTTMANIVVTLERAGVGTIVVSARSALCA